MTEAEKLLLKQQEFQREQAERNAELERIHRENHPELYNSDGSVKKK